MLPIKIDPELCKADELCVHECPLSVLTMGEKGRAPVVHPKKANYCINCGHCAAICPTNAITLTAFPGQQSIPFTADNLPEYAEVETLIRSRRSIRRFKKKQLGTEVLTELIHLAAYAPSGHNAQPVSWTVIDDPEKVQETAGAIVDWMEEMVTRENPLAKKLFLSGLINAYRKGNDVICRSAPALAVSWAPLNGITPQADTVLATAYLELAAHAKGIGACWAGYLVLAAAYSEKVRTLLGVPEGHMIHGALMLGYPAVKYKNTPPRHKASGEKQDGLIVFKARSNSH
ncbi:nitroreductase family protein [Maridesulfovibrio sp. FT414]|uniref:nitroreductase family protein n=1 Tax=Maridesulfovibrio sp. FT414 TaxID=2979469 RepID=UPI003D808070